MLNEIPPHDEVRDQDPGTKKPMDQNIDVREIFKSFNRVGGSGGTAELKTNLF